MSEPYSAPIAGAASGVALVVLGAQVDALVIGLFAAFFVSIWLDSVDNKVKAGAAVLFSALLAAYASPVMALYVSASLPSVAGNMEALRLLLALVIGALTPSAVPMSIAYAANRLKG